MAIIRLDHGIQSSFSLRGGILVLAALLAMFSNLMDCCSSTALSYIDSIGDPLASSYIDSVSDNSWDPIFIDDAHRRSKCAGLITCRSYCTAQEWILEGMFIE